ncbi:hypothetical protein B0H13DRAFT_2318811 [Mycena leptocephala]|nr:hypothetical protein B0H13DRAFT_2318811 [Mycena leptocephala]
MGPVLYHIRVTEFQKRGLPHEHIALALRNIPQTPAEIHAFLSAPPLRDAVKRHMTHIHHPKKSTAVAGRASAKSSFNERGYFEHRRHRREDEFVASHIAWLILKYDCHINVEYSMGVNLFQYLFKYFYETNWSVRTTPRDTGEQSGSIRKPVDEIRD